MIPHRLRAPAYDGGLLCEPSIADAPASVEANRILFDHWNYDVQGRPAFRIRSMARAQVYEAARQFHLKHGLEVAATPALELPLVVTGHQPEMFHPGVWIKNFAVDQLAKAIGGVGLNLIVDNDIPKSSSIKVPTGAVEGTTVKPVEFDRWAGEIPFEDWPVDQEATFADFAGQVRATLAPVIADPLIAEFWPRVLAARSTTDHIGLRVSLARRMTEAAWGLKNLEVPLGAVCETDAFLWFASHLLAQLPRFQAVHNDALGRYRALYHIRSKNHPVPALTRQGDWLEAPFWAWRESNRRRRPLMARQNGERLELRIADESESFIQIRLAPDRDACCAVDDLRVLPSKGIRLRSRALTTTMFARLFIGDLFVHGIGGAKYDELGDEVVQGFFGITPPTYMTTSMTLRIGLETTGATIEEYHALGRQFRDLIYNPDRVLSEVPAELLAAKKVALGLPAETNEEKLFRFREIRKANEAFLPLTAELRSGLESKRSVVLQLLKRDTQAKSREYASVLHSTSRLRSAVQKALGTQL